MTNVIKSSNKVSKKGCFIISEVAIGHFRHTPELEKLGAYDSFLEKNQALKDEAGKTSRAEFMLQLPDNYSETNPYPLMLIMHGGWGSIPGMQYNYISEKLKSEFIVAYFQGSIIRASGLRIFEMEGWQPKNRDTDSTLFFQSAEWGLKVATLCGE